MRMFREGPVKKKQNATYVEKKVEQCDERCRLLKSIDMTVEVVVRSEKRVMFG